MSEVQVNKPLSVNLDKDTKSLEKTEAFILRNQERDIVLIGSGSAGKTTPMLANYKACEMNLPEGDNWAIGKLKSQLTGETYTWVHNQNGVHYIQRINSDGTCQVVYFGCLDLSTNPKHRINQFRAYLDYRENCSSRHGKTLLWTDGNSFIGCLDVEASIATNNFTTPFFSKCNTNPCDFVKLCVPDPCGCLVGEFVKPDDNDRGKKNNLVDAGFRFAYRHIYYDDRRSEWSDPSTLFYQNAAGCFESNDGLPRCIKLRVPVGNPMVDRIEIAYSKNGVWYSAEIVEKYKKYNSSQQMWYEREFSELNNFSESDCSFDYYFCNDKQCQAIDPKEFTRSYNPYPIKPQGILPIGLGNDRTALGFYNYEQGNCPIDKFQIQKIDISAICENVSCKQEFVTIKVRAIIHNRNVGRNQFIYRLNGDNNSKDDKTDTAYFGGLNAALDGGFEIGYDQYFRDETRNFIAYVEGTEVWAEMKQYKSHAYFRGTKELRGVLPNMDDVNRRNRWRRAIRNGEFFYQEAELRVLKGTKGFIRLSSHQSTGNDQNTSTFVIGTQNLLVYKGDLNTGEGYTEGAEEIYFDACSGDLDLTTAFFIDDNAVDNGGATKASAYYGYLKDKSSRPVEGAIVQYGADYSRTDHNGFYHFYVNPGESSGIDVMVKVEKSCYGYTIVKTENIQGAPGENISHDIEIDDADYDTGFYSTVNVPVKDCLGNPVGGVVVALSGSKYDVTDSLGIARFRIRNYYERNRQLTAIVMDPKGCLYVDCNSNCNPCMPSGTAGTFPCFIDKPLITFQSLVINVKSVLENNRGLKSGGRYPFGFVAKGNCGMQSAVNEIKYIDIPKTQEKNSDGFCRFSFNSQSDMILPEWVDCIQIVRGENVNPFELQWLVDKVERIDGKVRITIQSLNDYNEKYFFKTNTVYQWLKGDRVEFIKNGDGSIFDTATYGLLNYLTISPFHDSSVSGKDTADANYFNQILIDDDGRLDTLQKGALIELQRVKECSTDPIYYSICATIPVVNGTLMYQSGEFMTFDTYYVNRKIGEFVTQRFEHHSPSDFWGERMSDVGKPYFINKYENKKRYGRNITINAPMVMNYFGDMVKKFDPDEHGDIIAMAINDNSIGLCISEHDNSLFEVSDDIVRVDANGIVRVSSPDQVISDGQPKPYGKHGCLYDDILGIVHGDGFVSWLDSKQASLIKHDFNKAYSISEGKADSYFRMKVNDMRMVNSGITPDEKKMFVTSGVNVKGDRIYVTIKSLYNPAVKNSMFTSDTKYDTICFDSKKEDIVSMASFLPEIYVDHPINTEGGSAFISFYKSIPYIHPLFGDYFNEFFGQAVDWVIGVSVNDNQNKLKGLISLEVQDKMLWFVKKVEGESGTFVSEIPPAAFQKTGPKWNASFLRNVNTIGGLYDGEPGSDFSYKVFLVRDNTDGLKYNSENDAKRVLYSSLDLLIFKYIFSEQSGFTSNR